jgi:hypothetical protein
MAKQSAIAKGFARGLTADTVGAPADLANTLSNLLRAGFGYAGNKLGLLKPEQMPELIPNDQVPLTSDWFAKNTPLEDTGEDGYTAARIVGGFAMPAAKVANIGSVGKVANQKQKGAILLSENTLRRNKLGVASDAIVRLPTGEQYRPADVPINLKLLADLKKNPREVPLPELYPGFANAPEFKYDVVRSEAIGDPTLGGYHDAMAGRYVLNSNQPFDQMVNSAAHEVNHGGQSKAYSMDVGSNSNFFRDPDYRLGFDKGARFAEDQNIFPGEQLIDYQRQLRTNPHLAYRNSQGEIAARVGGGAAQLMSAGGSQVPHQHLLDALIRREGGLGDANIRLVLPDSSTGVNHQVFVPARLGKQLRSKDHELFNQLGDRVAISPAYR